MSDLPQYVNRASATTEPGFKPSVVYRLDELVRADRRFSTIYADPPWAYRNRSSRAVAVNHYATLSEKEICSLPLASLAATNAHLHLWSTVPLLEDALIVRRAWEFSYKSCFVWVKEQLGMGNYWRVSHELLLLGVRGRLPFRSPRSRSWLRCRRSVHSRTPESVRLIIERVSPCPYLELFGRADVHHPQWTVFGNQVEQRLF